MVQCQGLKGQEWASNTCWALTANLNWGLQLQQVGLAHENLLGCKAQHADVGLRELDLPAPAIPHFQQSLDDFIHLRGGQAVWICISHCWAQPGSGDVGG